MLISSLGLTIFFYKGLTKNSEIGNISVWDFPNIWRLGWVMIPNLAWTSLIKCYQMLQNARVAAFTVFELLRESEQGLAGRGVKLLPQPRLGLKREHNTSVFLWILRNSKEQLLLQNTSRDCFWLCECREASKVEYVLLEPVGLFYLNVLKNELQYECARVSFYWKKDSITGVFLWIFQIFKNIFFTEHLWMTASVLQQLLALFILRNYI